MFAVKSTKQALNELVTAINKHEFHSPEKIADLVTDKISKNLIQQTSDKVISTLSKTNDAYDRDVLQKTIETPATPSDQVLIIKNIRKEDITATGNKKSFSSVLQKNITKKLEDIPVTRTIINKRDEAVLKFPSVQSCKDAKNLLKDSFDVSNSTRKQPMILPRIKIHHIDPALAEMDKEILSERVLSKNPWMGCEFHDFLITFVEKNLCYAIAKVSPAVYHRLINDGKIFLELSSHKVTEYFAPIQCFKCQEFGHISGAPFCKAVNHLTCMYCSENHRSSECPSKKNKLSHKCYNCMKSSNPTIRNDACNHNSANKSCPIYLREIEKLKKMTCYDQKKYDAYLFKEPVDACD